MLVLRYGWSYSGHVSHVSLLANWIHARRSPTLTSSFRRKFLLNTDIVTMRGGGGWGGVVLINNGELGSAVLVLYATFTYRNTPLSRRYLQDSLHAANCSVWRSHSQCTEVHRWGHQWLPVHLAWTLTNCGRHEAFHRLSQRLLVLNQHDNSWSRYQPNNSTTMLYNIVLAWIRESGE